MNIQEYAVALELDLTCRLTHVGRWVASFKGVEVKEGSILKSEYGEGRTAALAIANYAYKIAGKRLVVNAMSDSRREFYAPEILYS